MNKLNLLLLPCVALTFTGCVDARVMEARPEIILKGVSIAKARSAVAQACDENQLFIDQQSENTVVCSKSANAMAQAWFGSQGGADVRLKTQFNIFSSADNGVKISGSNFIEDQNAFGRTDRTMLNDGPAVEGTRYILNTVQARLSKGGKK